MHGQIAALLGEDKNIVASTVTLQDAEHGMTEKKLDETDVLLWWGHAAHDWSMTPSSSAWPSVSGRAWG